MSDILASEAPEDDAAATAPASDAAAPADSVDSTEVIPKERFDGLMSRYQSDKRALEETVRLAEAEIERLSAAQAVKEPEVADEGLVDVVRALQADLTAERLSRARADAIAKYPGAAPLADLILGDTPQAIEEMAATLHARLAGLSAQAEDASGDASDEDVADAASDDSAPEVPVVGGAVAFDDNASIDDHISAALEAKDFTAFLRAAEQRADSRDAELTVG